MKLAFCIYYEVYKAKWNAREQILCSYSSSCLSLNKVKMTKWIILTSVLSLIFASVTLHKNKVKKKNLVELWHYLPLLVSTEVIGVWGFAVSLMAFCDGSDLGGCGGSAKAGSVEAEGASSAATDAASLAMERVVILRLRRPWLLAVFLPRGVFCSFPSSSSPPSHLSLSLLMSLQFSEWKNYFSSTLNKYSNSWTNTNKYDNLLLQNMNEK